MGRERLPLRVTERSLRGEVAERRNMGTLKASISLSTPEKSGNDSRRKRH